MSAYTEEEMIEMAKDMISTSIDYIDSYDALDLIHISRQELTEDEGDQVQEIFGDIVSDLYMTIRRYQK